MRVDPIVFALTGCRTETGPASVTERLAGIGWNIDRVRAFAASRQDEHLPWPLPVEGELLPKGRAAFAAALNEARTELDLVGTVEPPAPTRPLTIEEKRLVDERPPHWG